MYKNHADALAYSRKYYKENREKSIKAGAKWYQENKDKSRATKKLYYAKNAKRILERRREWYKKNPHKLREYQLRQNFGLSLAEYERMREEQGGVCAICKLVVRVLVVDHSHKEGHIRGLLCHKCNSGLGYFIDSTENMESAIIYLKKDETTRQTKRNSS